MKIVIFETEPREAVEFDTLKPGHDLTLTQEPLRRDNAARYAGTEVISTFIYSELDRAVLEQFPALKLIATRSTGYDHIDMAWCAAHGVTVSNVPTYGENTVAEHVFALLLSISHRLREATERARSGHFSPQGLEGFDLQGKTLGVVGTGNIGRHVIRIAKGFAMEVVAFDVKPDDAAASGLGYRYSSLEDVLAAADVITLHVPALPQTTHLVDDKAFAHMKPGAVLINTARGSVVEPRALIEALVSGRLAAAGLDVLPDEPLIREEAELISSIYANQQDVRGLIADHVLLNLPNVIVTPHSAFNTREAIGRITSTTVSNITAFLAGRHLNVVIAR
ncbi:MAG TPA: hydroxyacid dehydrogenase [Pseudolabrys sp.]|nr:hydroxyacid dehydrogenase [Pseudolabrys sp.]